MTNHTKDMKGKQIYDWEIMSFSHIDKGGNAFWHCKCKCGNLKTLSGSYLRRMEFKNGSSCGSCSARNLKPYESLYKFYLVRGAKARNLSVDITYEQFLEFTKINKCHYCHTPLVWLEYRTRKNPNKSMTYNIDRKDNDLGYTMENCVACCSRCNKGKSNIFTYNEWYQMTNYFRSQNDNV
jgi:hypothetical protein